MKNTNHGSLNIKKKKIITIQKKYVLSELNPCYAFESAKTKKKTHDYYLRS